MEQTLANELQDLYNIKVDGVEKIIRGFTNQNYLILSGENRYVARISDGSRIAHMRFETDVLDAIRKTQLNFHVPKAVKNHFGEYFFVRGDQHILTLFEHIPGECALDSWYHTSSEEFSKNLGRAVGKLHAVFSSLSLQETEHSHSKLVEKYIPLFNRYVSTFSGKEWRNLLMSKIRMITEETQNQVGYLRASQYPKSIVHTDLRLDHILLDGTNISAILDFDDIVMGDQAYDLAKILVEIYTDKKHLPKTVKDLMDMERFRKFLRGYFRYSRQDNAAFIRRISTMINLPALHVLSIVGRDPDFDDRVRAENVNWYSDFICLMREKENTDWLRKELMKTINSNLE